ncbi:hypothetical protein CEN44_25090 [Fischerella muscicola CCMEE 5323]|uniref:Uncharacterized protein n=1 Tax=Fischerella muscicola CCMEE 5323 TaxID=2019572 RepID=A0A2N6JWG3_FISMU|nr:hypothetical protein CEN44_25090 [Fischerella muscicola CCMEE 5323]
MILIPNSEFIFLGWFWNQLHQDAEKELEEVRSRYLKLLFLVLDHISFDSLQGVRSPTFPKSRGSGQPMG